MNLLKKLTAIFAPNEKNQGSSTIAPDHLVKKNKGQQISSDSLNHKENNAEPTYEKIIMYEEDKKIKIDVASIKYAFVCLNHEDLRHLETARSNINAAMRHCQPTLWAREFSCKYFAFSAETSEIGYPSIEMIVHTIQDQCQPKSLSIAVNDFVLSFDGGRTNSNAYFGFAFETPTPKLILPFTDAIIPK